MWISDPETHTLMDYLLASLKGIFWGHVAFQRGLKKYIYIFFCSREGMNYWIHQQHDIFKIPSTGFEKCHQLWNKPYRAGKVSKISYCFSWIVFTKCQDLKQWVPKEANKCNIVFSRSQGCFSSRRENTRFQLVQEEQIRVGTGSYMNFTVIWRSKTGAEQGWFLFSCVWTSSFFYFS